MTQWEKGQHPISNLTLLSPSWVNLDRSLHFLSYGIFSLLTKCRNLITDLRGLFWLKEWVISPSSPWCWALVLSNLAFLPFSPFPLPFWNTAHNVSHTYPSCFFSCFFLCFFWLKCFLFSSSPGSCGCNIHSSGLNSDADFFFPLEDQHFF